LIAEHIDEIIYLASADFSEILYINPAYEDIYGQPVEELYENPRSFIDAAHPADRDQYEQDVQQIVADIADGNPDDIYEGEYRLQRGDERRWVTVTRSPVENEDGTVDRIVGRVQDVTERKRREREYEQIFNAVQDAILVMDPDTLDILDANAAYLDLVGYDDIETIQELGVEGLSAVQEGFTVEEGRQIHQRVAETGEPELVEWRAETKDGEQRWLEIKVAPAVINGEHVNVAIHRDVTEQRRMEHRFRLIADHIDEVILLASEDFTEVLYVNPAYETVWGRPVEDLYEDARAFVEAVDPRDREQLVADLETMVADLEGDTAQDSYDFEYRIRRPDGDLRWVSATGYAVELADGTGRFIGVSEDITGRKRREQRLEVLNRILRHNLRNQLDVIISHAEVLTERNEDESHSERIIAAANELSKIGARARAADQIMSTGDELREVDVPETLRLVVESVESNAGVQIRTDLLESATLVTNESALRTAARSALEKATDYADSVVTLSLEDEQSELGIVIDYDGHGIPKEELVPIQIGTETDLRHAKGLDLWQLRWSVDKLGGELTFDTTAGTTIRIKLPARSESEAI
jgi:PAS domain S-box-containing protein